MPLVTFVVLPLFAFANAGVTIAGNLTDVLGSPVVLGVVVVLGLVVGKPLGISPTRGSSTPQRWGRWQRH